MVVIRKKTNKNSLAQLLSALTKFIQLLENQNEEQAIKKLKTAEKSLRSTSTKPAAHKTALQLILATFEGDDELIAYTYSRQNSESEWGDAEELYLASTDVLSLVKRLLKTQP